MLFEHKWAKRSCRDCHKYQYTEEGEIMVRGGFHKVTMDLWNIPPCAVCPKIPKDEIKHADNAIELSDKNRTALWHWRSWRAVGGFPRSMADDEIVRRNALIIGQLYEQYDRQPINELISTVMFVNSLSRK